MSDLVPFQYEVNSVDKRTNVTFSAMVKNVAYYKLLRFVCLIVIALKVHMCVEN